MQYQVRELRRAEYDLLRDFLYEAIFLPPETDAPPRDIIERPELRLYYENFGARKGDEALVAEQDGRVVGAVWARIMQDYGHVDDRTPSLAISLYPECRGQGIGTALLRGMLARLGQKGYRQASLAVQKENYALRLYQKAGFEVVAENEQEYIMLCRLG